MYKKTIKKLDGKLELHISLASHMEAQASRDLMYRIGFKTAKQLLVEAGHNPGNRLTEVTEVRNDKHNLANEGVFVFEDLEAKKIKPKVEPKAAAKKSTLKKSIKKAAEE